MADLSAEMLDAPTIGDRETVSALLENLKRDVPESRVTFGWLADYWHARSPEVPILFLGIVGMLPGVSVFAGALIAVLAAAMISAETSRVLPAFLASQRVSSARLVRAIDRSVPWFRWSEQFVRQREASLVQRLRPIAGAAILVLSLTLLVPLPLSNVVPSMAIAVIAFASIEADGLLLSLSLAAGVASFAITTAVVIAALRTAVWFWG